MAGGSYSAVCAACPAGSYSSSSGMCPWVCSRLHPLSDDRTPGVNYSRCLWLLFLVFLWAGASSCSLCSTGTYYGSTGPLWPRTEILYRAPVLTAVNVCHCIWRITLLRQGGRLLQSVVSVLQENILDPAVLVLSVLFVHQFFQNHSVEQSWILLILT